MRLGLVVGRLWATAKDQKLLGIKLAILQPVDETQKAIGQPLVAADIINSKEGDLVYWVTGAEATFPLSNLQIPSDASIVGLVDRLEH